MEDWKCSSDKLYHYTPGLNLVPAKLQACKLIGFDLNITSYSLSCYSIILIEELELLESIKLEFEHTNWKIQCMFGKKLPST